MKTIYRTWVRGNLVYQGESLETAIRCWDAETYNLARSVAGGISVQQFLDDLMMRDGWILHVHEDGTVYLNPQLTEASTD